uniref:Ubiquitin-like domain-containing protein n=1 Tax=Trieres chinensis TaxID=1514140 RepID=A0A7S2A6T7_TRICV|mmetsp:Transcript_47/g.103  ORF Transcript_47/g.103 Transcript_47/m.103 type:complete len:113 (+) Transcript_47:166-504(+)|eukprot:CAMPEP_0183294872 /NCGR_PEP_ID=MMETSP0160_2-20130417/3030_1 /TAXON_ID=2839 ORGANISM="Odontella Sinensis, Strain Grunow 1884" /NCGR_SAMPLE_ID=MMETSP0160_2 /ASSEMBLY_ACC=CAM_ASM_000250 /LENGTH=112 /DNA_ID=CAMNT_0025456255 /DNA_START=141 /DNA_END=479 /DNA_ORIENTATION=-
MSSANKPIYVRCKRRDQTYFVFASKTDTIFHVKERVSEALGREVSPRKMRVYLTEKATDPLPDSATLADHDVGNDDCLYVVFRKAGMDGDDDDDADDGCWEDVEVIRPDLGA